MAEASTAGEAAALLPTLDVDVAVLDGRLSALAERERKVLELVADGLTNRQIAERLTLAEKTVKNHVSSMLAKLGLERGTQAAVLVTSMRSKMG